MKKALILLLLAVPALAGAQRLNIDRDWRPFAKATLLSSEKSNFVSVEGGMVRLPQIYDVSPYRPIFLIVGGRRYSPHYALGVGVGLVTVPSKAGHYVDRWDSNLQEYYEVWRPDRQEYISMPLFVRVEGRLMPFHFSPIASFDMGVLVPLRSFEESKRIRGFFIHPEIGVSYRIGARDEDKQTFEMGAKVGRLSTINPNYSINSYTINFMFGFSF